MTRRGVALVLVLLVLIVSVTAAASVAQLSVSTRSRAAASHRSRLAMSLLRAADDRIRLFLHDEGGRAVLPPDVPDPRLLIVDHSLDLDGSRCRITINAYDQCGMVPWGLARPGSPLRASLPPQVALAWDAIAAEPGRGPMGFDLHEQDARDRSAILLPSGDGAIAPGSFIATHNPDPADASGPMLADSGLINVNTAPRPLLERALRASGASGLERISSARARGEPSPAPAAAVPSRQRPTRPAGFRLVSQSDCWAFRVDIQVGSTRVAWWCVCRATGSQWRCVQRVLVNQ